MGTPSLARHVTSLPRVGQRLCLELHVEVGVGGDGCGGVVGVGGGGVGRARGGRGAARGNNGEAVGSREVNI